MDSPELKPLELSVVGADWRSGTPTETGDQEQTRPKLMQERRFKDPVHDWITLSHRICKIIDTPQYQRLRQVKQLGTSHYVWPAASHNRFEHCLGVAHLAKLQITFLRDQQPELGITDEDVDCVTIAGLCHDLGHGPWSHVWDSLFIPKALPGKKWAHEDASEMMFGDLIKEEGVEVSEREAIIIKALIAGDPSRCEHLRNVKPFLFEIVANKRTGLDVDKFDYMARDTRAIGTGESISIIKLIHSARVIKNQICYNIKDAHSVYELFWTRFSLHKRIYNHKTARAIEYMIIDALLSAEPHLKIAEQINDPKRYVHLTDDIKGRIEMSTDPELAEARSIFQRINRRDLYKCVDFKIFPWDYYKVLGELFTPAKIVKAAKNLPPEQPKQRANKLDDEFSDDEFEDGGDGEIDPAIVKELDEKLVLVDRIRMHYGMKDKNPMDSVRFYSKLNPNKGQPATRAEFSGILPNEFGEVVLRIYVKDRRFHGIVHAGFNQLLGKIDKLHSSIVSNGGQTDDNESINLSEDESVPIKTPSTPRAIKRSLSRVASGKLNNGSGGDMPGGSTSPSPFIGNGFTVVPRSFAGMPPASPSPTGKNLGVREKRRGSDGSVGAGSGSPPRKKGRKL